MKQLLQFHRFALCCGLTIAHATAQQVPSPAEFLRELITDPKRTPAYEEGVRVMDQIASMQPNEVRATLSVILEALRSQRQIAQLEGALALHAIAIRADRGLFLDSHLDEILSLLQSRESRLKRAAVIITEKMQPPAPKVVPVFRTFLEDPSQPAEVKPGVVGALVRMTAFSPESTRVIGAFFARTAEPSVRIETLQAVGSIPVDSQAQADLILLGIRDTNADVRNSAVSLLKRLGPKAISRASADLLKVTQNSNERSDVRSAAEQALGVTR